MIATIQSVEVAAKAGTLFSSRSEEWKFWAESKDSRWQREMEKLNSAAKKAAKWAAINPENAEEEIREMAVVFCSEHDNAEPVQEVCLSMAIDAMQAGRPIQAVAAKFAAELAPLRAEWAEAERLLQEAAARRGAAKAAIMPQVVAALAKRNRGRFHISPESIAETVVRGGKSIDEVVEEFVQDEERRAAIFDPSDNGMGGGYSKGD